MLIDSHCHLDFEEFDSDRDHVLEAARTAGVSSIVVPGVSKDGWQRTLSVCQTHDLHYALGLHPMFIDQHQPQHLLELDELVSTHQPVAVGEIGLDFWAENPASMNEKSREKQLAYFDKQLIIAKRHALPVIIHCRKAHDDCIKKLREQGIEGGIIHAFNGSLQQAEKYQELGFLLGFGGMLTFSRSRKLRSLAEKIPLNAIALETDAPDMTVAQYRGQRNSPAYLPFVAQALAAIKRRNIDEIVEITSNNVRQCLALPAAS